MSSAQLSALQLNKACVQRWGFFFCLEDVDEQTATLKCGNLVRVDRVPSLFGTPLTAQVSAQTTKFVVVYNRHATLFRFQDLLEYAELLTTLFSRSAKHVGKIMPPALLRLLQSKSCRGAVMFGDLLSQTQCAAIVEGLVKCQFPFNCAHGRPTMSPLGPIPLYV